MFSSLSSTFLVQIPFPLRFPFADAVCFIPVDFCQPDSTTAQAYSRYTFEFTPAASAVRSTQPRDLPDLATDGYSLYVGDLAKNFKIHRDCVPALIPHPTQPRQYLQVVVAGRRAAFAAFEPPDEVFTGSRPERLSLHLHEIVGRPPS